METGFAIVVLITVLMVAYWILRGIGQLFERYNPVLILLYLFVLTPIAIVHAFLLGVFGESKQARLQKAVEAEVDYQIRLEREREGGMR